LGYADDICSAGHHNSVSASVNRIVPTLAAAGLNTNVTKSAFVGTAPHLSIRIGQNVVFDRGEQIEYLGYPISRNKKECQKLLFRRLLSITQMAVPTLYSLKYTQAVTYINQRLAPRIAYIARLANLHKHQLDQIDRPIMRLLQRHPGKYHAGTISKGALFATLNVQFPSIVSIRSRLYFLNAHYHPSIKCPYLSQFSISLPQPRPSLRAALNKAFYGIYTAAWMDSRSGELARSCPPIVNELRRIPDKRKHFALAFICNSLPTAHTLFKLNMHNSPQCACGRGACTSRHILKWHAKMSLKRIHWKQLMRVCRPLLLRLPK
jgi:hypothetical protein